MANPKMISLANLYSWAAHNIERTADRSTNICERTIYCATGQLIEIEDLEDL